MQIVEIAIDKLKDYENNPRNNEKAVEAVAESIKEFGFKVPIVIDRNNIIVAGHTRKKASELLGLEKVPCIVADDLTPEKIKAYRLADNKTAELAEWDFEKLEKEMAELTAFDFDMTAFGFDESLFNFDINQQQAEDDGFDEQQALEEIEEPTTQLGDIWQLGKHRLICGDSTDKSTIERLLKGNKVDMVFTDPPYNMDYCGKGVIKEGSENVRKRIEHIIDFDANSISYIKNLDIGSFYFFTSKDLIYQYMTIFKDFKFNLLFWGKSNPTPFVNNCFLPDVEYLLYFYKNNRIWNNGLPFDTYKKYYISSKLKGREGAGDLHPTMKPIELIANNVQISSNDNGIVLDLFGGSGSTLIACEQLNRQCFMVELDEKYCDVIIKRWETLTGQKAELLKGEEL